MHLLQLDYGEAFHCPVCRFLPPSERTLLIDGIRMGHRTGDDDAHIEKLPPILAERYAVKNFALIKDKATRDAIEAFLEHQCGTQYDKATTLLSGLKAGDGGCFLDAFQFVAKKLAESRTTPGTAKALAAFVRTVARDSPVLGSVITPHATMGTADSVLDQLAMRAGMEGPLPPAMQQQAAWHVPFLAPLLRLYGWEALRAPLRPMLDGLNTLVKQCVATVGLPDLQDNANCADGAAADDEADRVFAPSLTARRPIVAYGAGSYDGKDCSKYIDPAAPGISHGLVVLHCPHGLFVGFDMLEQHEGPVALFEMLSQRCEQAPYMIVYDNAW